MTTKLHTVLALLKGTRQRAYAANAELRKTAKKNDLYAGIARRYQPRKEDGDTLPEESTLVQQDAGDILEQFVANQVKLWDLTGTMEATSGVARADIVTSNNTVLATDVPATFMLFLERQLDDVRTFINDIPTLNPAEVWHTDPSGTWATEPFKTVRTKKIPRNHVIAPATDKHPAQVQVFTEDEIVGDWTTIKYSGALAAGHKREIIDRIDALKDAVKSARERANEAEVVEVRVAARLFDYLLGGS
jgi:hypothetical protein